MSAVDELRAFKAKARALRDEEKTAMFSSPDFKVLVNNAHVEAVTSLAASRCRGHCVSHCISHCISHTAT